MIAIVSSLYIVSSRNIFYSAIALAFLGISVALLIALISPIYAIYSVIHLLLYVGSTVVFLAVSLVMFKGIFIREFKVKWAPVISIIISALLFISVITSFSEISGVPQSFEYVDITSLGLDIVYKYWFPVVVIIIALITTIIEAIAIAKRD
jgi:NADH-quinone oxidoreductase subunit J